MVDGHFAHKILLHRNLTPAICLPLWSYSNFNHFRAWK